MARKGIISVDIKKENPLLTIVKAGKIPVVRLSRTGFQNYKQEKYFESHGPKKNHDEFDCRKKRGCFVSLLGVQGNYVCGGHYGETINIGYIEPSDIVFGTYCYGSGHGKNEFIYNTAEERFILAKKSYQVFFDDVERKEIDPDDYDIYSEAIVDSKKIKKVTTIKAEDYGLLVPYCNDGMFRIFRNETIFCHLIYEDKLSKELMDYMHWNVKHPNTLYYKDVEVYELMDNEYYKKIILEEFVHFYTFGNHLRDEIFYITLQDKLIEYMKVMNSYYDSTYRFNDNIALRYFNEKELKFSYHENDWRKGTWNLTAKSTDESVKLSIEKTVGYSWEKDGVRTENEVFLFNNDNILSQKFRNFLYKLVEMKNIFEEYFGDIIHLEYPQWMSKLEAFCNLEKAIHEWTPLSYSYNEKNCELTFTAGDNFKFVYNIVLLDGVVEVKEKDGVEYYNTDNLPDDYDKFWLNTVLELLKDWETFVISSKE